MPTPFPHHYDAMLTWNGHGPAAIGSEGRPTIAGGAPPEFGGEPGRWSPEHLLLASLNLCLQATFESLARRKGLEVAAYRSHAVATLAPVPEGLGFTYIALEVEIEAARIELEGVERERRDKQASVQGEVESLERGWREGVGKLIEVLAAAEGARGEILERRRVGAS